MSHIYCCFFVFKNFYYLQDVLFNLFNMLGINVCCNFSSKLHQQCDGVGAKEGNGHSEVRVVLLQFDFLKVFLYSFVDLMRNLSKKWFTAFSGRKRNSLKISMKRVPKGTISTIANTQYQIFKKMVKINHFVHSFSWRLFFILLDQSSKTIRQTKTEQPMTVSIVELKSQKVIRLMVLNKKYTNQICIYIQILKLSRMK